jgi:hypothetical protein
MFNAAWMALKFVDAEAVGSAPNASARVIAWLLVAAFG